MKNDPILLLLLLFLYITIGGLIAVFFIGITNNKNNRVPKLIYCAVGIGTALSIYGTIKATEFILTH
jgi:hypothetical protein